jgi:hypothetical protein
MKTFWITFTDGSEACCQGLSEYHTKQLAEHLTGKKVGGGPYKCLTMKPLPYPAEPCIWKYTDPIIPACPSFCFDPKQCAGRTSCPRRYACTE